jgi:protease-4
LKYYLASAAEKIYLSENTLLPLSGLSATYVFLGGVWEKLDIDMQVEKIREYKTAGDFLARKTMSEFHREMANSLLDSLNGQFLAGIAEARGLTSEQVQAVIDTPTVTPEDFHKAGLVGGVRYFAEILQELSAEGEKKAATVSLDTYRKVKPSSLGLMQGPKIAVVYGVGGITTGKSRWEALGPTMGDETVTEAIQQAVQNKEIRAIVFRVDSPGGSALASDLIWRAVVEAKEKKPIVVSMSGVAASGGYYIATAATKIVAQPATLTGSIGVVFALPNVEGFLQKLGLSTETLSRGRYARLFDASKSWSAEERQQVQRIMEGVYQTFTRKVAEGRGLSLEETERLSRGRVWTGEQAKERGLVDELGGIETALRLAKEEAGIPVEAEVELVFYPQPKNLLETVLERLQGGVEATVILPPPLQEILQSFPPFWAQARGPLLAMPMLLEIQ